MLEKGVVLLQGSGGVTILRRCRMERLCCTRAALLLIFLFMLTVTLPPAAEARHCESQSHNFSGLCFSESNCGHVCKTEGFHGGKCRGFRRRCFCTKHCA